jgi:hypothetical protein
MIKRLLLLTALLAPALAYGAKPSNDFSVQIVPAGNGSSGGGNGGGGSVRGSPTAPGAALAGCQTANGGGPTNGSCFSTLALNLDLTGATQSFVANSTPVNATTLSNWLDCAGASSPIMYHVTTVSGEACSDYSIINDGGTDALRLADPAGVNYVQVSTSPYNSQGGHNFPEAFYVEAKIRTDSQSIANMAPYGGQPFSDFWAVYPNTGCGSCAYVEWDFSEIYSNNSNGFATARTGSFNNYNPGGITINAGSNYSQTSYSIIGARITNDGNGNVAWCVYANNVQQGCTSAAETASWFVTPLQIIFDSSSGGYAVSGPTNQYVEWLHVWECSNWNAINSPPYEGNYCSGAVLTTNP